MSTDLVNARDPRLDWIQRYADGLAAEEEAASLERALRDDAELRAAFLEYVNLDSALEALAAANEAEVAEKLVRFPRPMPWRWAAAAAVLLSLIGGWLIFKSPVAAGPTMREIG